MRTFLFLTVLSVSSSFGLAQNCTDSSNRTYSKQLSSRLTATERLKAGKAAKASSIRTMTHASHADGAWLSDLRDEVTNQLGPSLSNSADIESLIFVVMMEVAASTDQDLKEIMAQVKAENEAKKALRDNMERMREYLCDLKKKMADEYKHHKP